MNLWRYQGPDGQSLFKAVDYLLPAATGPRLAASGAGFRRYAADDVVHAAADAGDRTGAGGAFPRWRRRPAATCGPCARPPNNWTPIAG